MDASFTDRGIAVGHGKEHAVFIDGGELGDESRKCGIAIGATESHFDMVAHGLGGLCFESGGALIPEEARLVSEAGIDETHGMTSGRAIDASARERSITEAVLLLVAGGATDGVVARESFVVKQDASESGTGIGDGIRHGRVRAGDVNGFPLIRVIRERGQINDAFLRGAGLRRERKQ